MNYNGFANIDYVIYRLDTSYEEVAIVLEVNGKSYFQHGQLTGPLEKCYPDEGETEILSVKDISGQEWKNELTEEEYSELLELIDRKVQQSSSSVEEDFAFDSY